MLAALRGNDEGWGSTLIVALFAGAAALLAAFLALERRVAEPMLPLGLFKRPAFAISSSLFVMFLYMSCTSRTTSACRRSRPGCGTCRSRSPAFCWRRSPALCCRECRRA